jgi:2-keto-4-pentenoate hydratase/2-oxohepta-3-ene-1,7-dioic acid hydratase in catechol pathway
MKLVRFGPPGHEKPGIIDSAGGIRDLSSVVADIAGDALTPEGLAKIRDQKIDQLPKVTGNPRLGPCVGQVRHYIAIGLNYADHAAEAGQPLPKEPIIFSKAPTSICGPNDDTITPKESTKLDYEIELGIVIGRRARYLEKAKAMDAVAGYFLANDVSERDFQIARSGGQWDKGKGCETFGPIGPWLVTKDEIADPQALDMWLTVNGDSSEGSTKTMIFGVERGSGTARGSSSWSRATSSPPAPPGVALMKPQPKFLKAGDVVRLGITGLGEQQQSIVPPR